MSILITMAIWYNEKQGDFPSFTFSEGVTHMEFYRSNKNDRIKLLFQIDKKALSAVRQEKVQMKY